MFSRSRSARNMAEREVAKSVAEDKVADKSALERELSDTQRQLVEGLFVRSSGSVCCVCDVWFGRNMSCVLACVY